MVARRACPTPLGAARSFGRLSLVEAPFFDLGRIGPLMLPSGLLLCGSLRDLQCLGQLGDGQLREQMRHRGQECLLGGAGSDQAGDGGVP